MPLAVRSDNGAPFASRAIAGLSRLAVYLMAECQRGEEALSIRISTALPARKMMVVGWPPLG